MTLEEINYISQTIGAAAVIASLVYLAIQTRQAARASRAAMHENRASVVLRHIEQMTDAEFHPIWARGNAAASDMSDADIARFINTAAGMVVVWEERFRQKREGMLDDSRWASSEYSISQFLRQPGFRAAISFIRPRLDPGFVAIIDKHVALGRAAPVADFAAAWREAAANELAATTIPLREEHPQPSADLISGTS